MFARTQPRSAAARGWVGLLLHQTRYDLLRSIRNPRAVFMTFAFPILLLIVFNGIFGHGHTNVAGASVQLKVFYVPGIIAMSIVIASYGSLVISMSSLRETGVLKRRRATPAPPAMLIIGQALTTVVITFLMTAILLIIADFAYDVTLSGPALGALAVTVLVGSVTFACIGYAVSGMIGSPESAQPVVQATLLPLWFVSGVFIPPSDESGALRNIGKLFPVEHLADSLHLASVHSSFGASVSGYDLLILALWGIAAAGFCMWRFSWLPSSSAT
jgi:ABC-2 type transport system permease protein